jgi:hypothetical protein
MARRQGGGASIGVITGRELVATRKWASDVENGRRRSGARAR